jgi:hypothetical protein
MSGCLPGEPACNLGKDSSGIPLCPLSASYLEHRLEGQLVFPGARIISRESRNEEVGLDGNSDASVGLTLEAPASADEIQSWYTAALTVRGWSAVPAYTPPTFGFYRPPREYVTVLVLTMDGSDTRFSYGYSITTGGWRGL